MNFQTERILNNLNSVKKAADADLTAGDGFFLDYGCYLQKDGIVDKKIYKTVASDGALESYTIETKNLVVGKLYKFALDVRLVDEFRSDYNRFDIFNGKPFVVQFMIPASANTVVKVRDYVNETITAGITKAGVTEVKLSVDKTKDGVAGTEITTITVTATLFSQVFDKITISELTPIQGATYGEDYESKVVVSGVLVVKAKEPFGSAWWITKNLRLPTEANTRFMAVNKEERPIDGAKYNQYFFQYKQARNINGLSVVGQETTSITEHIVYVISDQASAFETLVKTATGISVV